MVHTARKPPACQNVQPCSVRKKTGRPTTNQTSREANRKIRAPASTLTERLLENICRNFALASGRPSSPRISTSTDDQRGADERREDPERRPEADDAQQQRAEEEARRP